MLLIIQIILVALGLSFNLTECHLKDDTSEKIEIRLRYRDLNWDPEPLESLLNKIPMPPKSSEAIEEFKNLLEWTKETDKFYEGPFPRFNQIHFFYQNNQKYKKFSKTYGPKQFAKIDVFLRQEVDDSETIEANFNAARNWLELRYTKAKEETKKDKYKVNIKPIPREGLLIFLELEQFLSGDQNKCDQNAYKILKRNYNAKKYCDSFSHIKSCPRIGYIIEYFANKNAKMCHQVYANRFITTYKSLDKNLLHLVEFFCDQLFAWPNRVANNYRSDHHDLVYDYRSQLGDEFDVTSFEFHFVDNGFELVERQHVRWIALQVIELLGSQNNDLRITSAASKSQVKTKKQPQQHVDGTIQQLTMDYLMKPCLYYIIHMGPNIFMPATFSGSFERGTYGYKPPKELERDWYFALAQFKICKNLLERSDDFINRIILVADQIT